MSEPAKLYPFNLVKIEIRYHNVFSNMYISVIGLLDCDKMVSGLDVADLLNKPKSRFCDTTPSKHIEHSLYLESLINCCIVLSSNIAAASTFPSLFLDVASGFVSSSSNSNSCE